MTVTLAELEQSTRAKVDAVSDDPEGRYRMRESFYTQYGFGEGAGYGSSELAFLRWEVERGVLNPTWGQQPGSPWWRGVNSDFLYDSELAGAIHAAGLSAAGTSLPTRFWLDYLTKPDSKRWYQAHNTSIVTGYANWTEEALKEDRPERLFMNIVLYRLLYAQAMVRGEDFAFGPLGKLIADPELPSVDIIVNLPDFYPDHYPLTREGIRAIEHKGHSIEETGVRLLDDVLIIPNLSRLYRAASRWLQQRTLTRWIRHGAPAYPTPVLRWHKSWLGRALTWLRL